MPRSSSHRSPSRSYSRESSVCDPVYTVYYGVDHTLQFDPPVGSKELAVALSYHFPGKGSTDDMMKAAMKQFLREDRKSRESSKSDSRGRSTNGRLPTPQSEEKHRISRSSAPRLSEHTQPPPLPPRASVSKSDEQPDSTSSGKHRSRRAVSSHVEKSDRKSSHKNDAPYHPADADADERPTRLSYGASLGVPSSGNSRPSKSADSHRRRRADSSGDEADLKILAWNPEVQGFKEKQKKRRYEKEEREQVRANRGHACEEHRKRRVKCDPEKCPNNGQAVKRRDSRVGRSQSIRPPSTDLSNSTPIERPSSSSTMGNSSISFQPPNLFPGYGNNHIRASSENPNARLTPYPSVELIPQEFSPEFNHHDTGYGLYPSSVTISNQDVYFVPENLPLNDGYIDPNWNNDQYFLNIPISEPYSNDYSSHMDPISQVGLPQDQFYNPNLDPDFGFMQPPYSENRGIDLSDRPRSSSSRPTSNQGLSDSYSSTASSPKLQSRSHAPSPAPVHRRREHSPDTKRRTRSPSSRQSRSHKREESPPASTWQCIKSLATEVSELPNTYKRKSASTYGSNQLDVPGVSRSSGRRSVSTSKGSCDIDDLSSKFSSWAKIH